MFFSLFASVWQPSQNPGDALAGTTINKRYIFDSRALRPFGLQAKLRVAVSRSRVLCAILLYHIVYNTYRLFVYTNLIFIVLLLFNRFKFLFKNCYSDCS